MKEFREFFSLPNVHYAGISIVNLSLFADTKAKFCEDLSNDEMWSLPCFIYPDYQIRFFQHFYAPQGAFFLLFIRLSRYE